MLGIVAQGSPINAMGRFCQMFAQKTVFQNGIQKGVLTQLPANNTAPSGLALLTGKQPTYKLLKDMQTKVKDSGVLPSAEDLEKFRSHCVANKTNMINAADKNGNTLLSHVVNNTSACPIARKKCINDLHADGAQLNPRDEYTMGTMANLAYAINKLRLNASASSIVQTYRTLLTKNTYEKLAERVEKGTMTRAQMNDRLEHVKKAEDAYAKAAHEGLLIARKFERKFRKEGLLNK